MKKIFYQSWLAALLSLSVVWGASAESVKVVVTNFPLYDFAQQVGQDKVDVLLLLPPGAEAHSYRPTPMDVMRISRADVFLYTGESMEPWVEDMLKGLASDTLLAVDTSRILQEKPTSRVAPESLAVEHDDHIEFKDLQGHGSHGHDPHFWLDPILAQKTVLHIADALALKDPEHKHDYQEQAEIYNQKLQQLDIEIRRTLAKCKKHTIIFGGHSVFGYFSRQYGLEYVTPYKGFSPDAEPNPRSITELIKKMRQHELHVVYYGELVNSKVAQVIAQETGAKLLLLHGAHNITKTEHQQGITYLSIMHENLERLKEGLEYQK